MNDRTRRFVLAASAAAAVAVLLLTTVAALREGSIDWPWGLGLAAFPVAAALLLARRPRNRVGRALGGVGVSATIVFALSVYAVIVPAQSSSARAAEAVGTVGVVCVFGSLLLLIHIFPTGTAIGRWHAVAIRALWTWWVVAAVAALLRAGPMDVSGQPNPFGVGGSVIRTLADATLWFMPLFAVLGVIVLALRRQRADAVERAQLKWFFAAATTVLFMIVMLVVSSGEGPPLVQLGIGLFIVAALWSIPIATVIAVTRHGLFEIDRIVSRTASYGVVGAVLGCVYAISVVVLQWALPVGRSSLAVAASTLAAAALFSPVRRRVQHALDRRFNRSRYEADVVAQRFAQQLRSDPSVSIDVIRGELADVIGTTLQPQAIKVWLGEPSAGR